MTAMTKSSSAAAANSKCRYMHNNGDDEIEEDSIQQVQPPEVKER